MKSFKQYNEEKTKEVVFTFGRFNPPTIGHEKLLETIAKIAKGRDYKIFASQSNKPEKDPLEYKEKVTILRKMFPKYARNIILDTNLKSVFNIAVYLYDQGYTDITMVVGDDRVGEFKALLPKYNDVKARHGYYKFNNITIQSAGKRDPDADDVTGMSASKMRAAATAGDFQAFSNGIPKAYGNKLELFNLLRKRMGLKEMTNFRKHVELETTSIRERYVAGDVFCEGDEFINSNGETLTVSERKANYVVGSDNKKYFINKILEITKNGN